MKITLITGGAGYIGSLPPLPLSMPAVLVLDNLCISCQEVLARLWRLTRIVDT